MSSFNDLLKNIGRGDSPSKKPELHEILDEQKNLEYNIELQLFKHLKSSLIKADQPPAPVESVQFTPKRDVYKPKTNKSSILKVPRTSKRIVIDDPIYNEFRALVDNDKLDLDQLI